MAIRTAGRLRGWRTPLAVTLVGLLALSAGCLGRNELMRGAESAPQSAPTPQPAATATQRPVQPDATQPPDARPTTTVRLSFGGDAMFEEELRELLEQPRTGLAPITAATAAADFTMLNLEAAVTTGGTRDPKDLEDPGNRYHFRTSASALTALHAAGVDAVSVANNHGADFGAEGLSDTLQAKSSSPIPILGVGRNRGEAFTPHRVTLKGQRFAFFAADASFLESSEPYWQAGATAGLAAARGAGRTALLAAVQREAAAGAAPVVYLHWGKENSVEVTEGQKALARALALAGAAAVVGTHTHTLQAAGWLGSTYVAYGLGNFIWYHGSRGAETGLLDLTLTDGRVVADGFRPALIPREGGLPRFLSGISATEAAADWRALRPGSGLAAKPAVPVATPASFTASVSPITPAIRRRMASSYREGCPVPIGELRYLRLSYWDFSGRLREGELVVAAEHAQSLVGVFRKLHASKFPFERMRLVSDYGGDDDKSMAANNTSAFNCRTVAGTDRWSQHSFGAAVDLNPVQNPYVTGTEVSPAAGEAYAEPDARRSAVKGLITAESVVVRAFREAGWEWGGAWTTSKDYQHFSAAGS
jgi:poly-gamma-glutamate synthesis protein (capsule biosynthesis protein)